MGIENRNSESWTEHLANNWLGFAVIFLTITLIYLHDKFKNAFRRSPAHPSPPVPISDECPPSSLRLPTVPSPPSTGSDTPTKNINPPDPNMVGVDTPHNEGSDPYPELLDNVDPGMVEISIALAALATTVATFLPSTEIFEDFDVLVAVLSSIFATFSSFSALWFLALYCLENKKPLAFLTLIGSPSYGPFWLLALALLIFLGISLFLLTLVGVR